MTRDRASLIVSAVLHVIANALQDETLRQQLEDLARRDCRHRASRCRRPRGFIVTNPFEALADRQISSPRKARERAAEKRAQTRAEKALSEREQQFALWRKWRHERCDGLLASPCATAACELLELLDNISLDDAERLVAHVRAGPWRGADLDTRFLILAAIDNAIVELRERNGLSPFDDSLPGQPANVFLILREALA
jgi:hypothetical protein